MPSVFYDQWIWKYYWGPVVADAAQDSTVAMHNGVEAREGYTLVSEITYGVILIIAVFAIYKLLQKLRISINWRFCLALLPYIIFGSAARVLEDAGYFSPPVIYWFISPLIYVQIAVYALFFILFGSFLAQKGEKKHAERHQVLYVSLILLGVNVFMTALWSYGASWSITSGESVIIYLLSCVSLLPGIWIFIKHQHLTVNTVLFSGGLLFFIPALYLMGRWIFGFQWAVTTGVRFDVFTLILGLVIGITAAVYGVSYKLRKHETITVYQHPLNLLMIAGHLIDGLTSYISIYDPLHMGLPLYLEKHPASNLIMELWPPLFPLVKFILIIAIIYFFDILYKNEFKQYGSLVNLLKIGIFILGFSPGLRDLLRVTMGV